MLSQKHPEKTRKQIEKKQLSYPTFIDLKKGLVTVSHHIFDDKKLGFLGKIGNLLKITSKGENKTYILNTSPINFLKNNNPILTVGFCLVSEHRKLRLTPLLLKTPWELNMMIELQQGEEGLLGVLVGFQELQKGICQVLVLLEEHNCVVRIHHVSLTLEFFQAEGKL